MNSFCRHIFSSLIAIACFCVLWVDAFANSNIVAFRNQLGVPYAVKNGAVELRGDATAGESPVYAHVATSDTTTEVVGKLNLVTFDDKQVQLCLVPVNGARLPNATQLQAELNGIFAPAVASVKVTTHGGVTIGYANGKNFVHGGSGWLSVYNTDQKTAIDALTDAQDDVYYLFFVDNAVKLDPDGNRTIVAGYMPICRRYGFIYDNPTSKYVAHELAHGAFALHHTFSDESESYHAPQGTTPNLMDYSGGTTLNHLQWQWMHESHTNLLGFLDDESEGELKDIDSLQVLSYLEKIHKANFDNKKSLVLNIDKDWSYGKSGQIALDESTELSYLFMFALTSNEEKGNTISDVTTTKAISIIPYERNKTVSTNDDVSYTTYKFETEQKFECLSFTVKTDECEVFENYLYGRNYKIKSVVFYNQFDEVIDGLDCHWCQSSGRCCDGTDKTVLTRKNKSGEEEKYCKDGGAYKTNNCCCATAKYMITQNGNVVGEKIPNSEFLVSLVDSKNLYSGVVTNADISTNSMLAKAKQKIKDGVPLLAGVFYDYHKSQKGIRKPINTDSNSSSSPTCHFVVLVGYGVNDNDEEYFIFYDPATSAGNSDSNKFMFNKQTNIIEATPVDVNSKNYILTEIRL